jgi:hypothetical protein
VTEHCKSPIPYERFVDSWFGDLAADEVDALEEHLVDCDRCTRSAEAWGLELLALAEGRGPLPRAFLTPAQVAAMGERAVVTDVGADPEPSIPIVPGKVHVFRVTLDLELLGRLERLDVEYRSDGEEPDFFVSDVLPSTEDGVPHLACHSHVLAAHGDTTVRLVGTERGRRVTVMERHLRFL